MDKDQLRQVDRQNATWFLQLVGFFGGAVLGVLFGIYVVMGVLMPGSGTGLLLTVVTGFIGAYVGQRLVLGMR